jgi:predicted nucleic acid-binding protein
MLMSSKIFLDSSILVEKAKGTKEELFDYLIGDDSVEKCINSIVLSEFTYYFLAIEGNASPMSLKMRKAIQPILKKNSPKDLLKVFTYLRDDSSVISLYLTFMEKYNMTVRYLDYCLNMSKFRKKSSDDLSRFFQDLA